VITNVVIPTTIRTLKGYFAHSTTSFGRDMDPFSRQPQVKMDSIPVHHLVRIVSD